jgi:ferritin
MHSRITPLIYAVKGLKSEVNQIFQDFVRETCRANDVKRIKDMFEAVLMEYNLREREINKLMEAIMDNDSKQLQ